MLRKTSKNLVKNVLSFTKVKLLYTRITLTRYTAVFFWAALINFIIGVVFQGISLQDHLIGDHVVSTIFQTANLNETTMGLPLLVGNTIRVCDGVPGVEGTSCNSMPVTHGPADNTDLLAAALLSHNSSVTLGSRTTSGCSSLLSKRDSSLDSARPVFDDNGKLVGVTPDGQILLDLPCITSFVWLAEMLRDAKREDIATLTFQIWLLTLAVVTILNESLPHLGTVLIGHVLLTGWAAFRICESFRLKSIYETAIVGGPCRNFDPMGNWWDVRLSHAIPMVVMNGLALLVMGGLSIKLFRVYAKQTFSRVGATAEIHHLYKLVLFLSACLQLTGFFTLVSAAIWIDKIGYGPARPFVEHFPIYLAGFIVTAVFTIPWLVLGWTSVRRERRKGLIAFFGLSFVMLSIAIAMFASPNYRFVFDRWPFFATMTVTSFVLMLATAFIGALCGRNFRKGLAQYLNVTDALEGEDFTPVMFSTEDSEKGSLYDDEKSYGFDNLSPRPAKKSSLVMARPTLPSLVSSARPNSSVYNGSQTKILSPTPAFLRDVESGPLSPPAHQRKISAPVPRTLRKNSVHKRGASDYDDHTFGMPTLSYQNSQPTSRSVKGNSPTSAKSTVSEFPPVLPPMPILEPLTRPRSTAKVGLPANPRRSRTLSSTSPSRSPSDSKPGYF